MKKQYAEPKFEIVTLVAEDIIATSETLSEGIGGEWETPIIP